MRKEVRTYLGNLDPASRYFPFIKERNGSIAEKIAQYQGLPFNPDPIMDLVQEKTYIVPGATLTKKLADSLFIRAEDDFYGTSAPEMDHVGKSILHQTLSPTQPAFYDQGFAREAELQNLVLPGYTGFSAVELQQAYAAVAGKAAYRLKVPNDTDGNGQYGIKSAEHLQALLSQIDADTIAHHGMVIEPELQNKSVVSAGQFVLGNDRYVFVANQKNAVMEGRDVFIGGDKILVARGGFKELLSVLRQTHDPRLESVQKAEGFLALFGTRHSDVLSSRMSVDVLSGYHPHHGHISGVTDITGRLGGLCGATSLAALKLQEKAELQAVEAQINLNYDTAAVQDYERGEDVVFFMNQQPLRISAKIDNVY